VTRALNTFEGWVQASDFVVVGKVLAVSQPVWNSASGEMWLPDDPDTAKNDVGDPLNPPEEYQVVEIEVELTLKGSADPNLDRAEPGGTAELVHSLTYGGELLSADLVGRRVLLMGSTRSFWWQDGTEDKVLTFGAQATYAELEPGVGVRLFDDMSGTTLAEREALARDFKGDSTLNVANFDELIERATNPETALEAQLGWLELTSGGHPDTVGPDDPP
jgi:hypothetical protein